MSQITNIGDRLFKLDTAHTSYVLGADAQNRLLHLYYGARISDAEALLAGSGAVGRAFAPYPQGQDPTRSPEVLPQEFAGFNSGDYRIGSATVRHSNGAPATDAEFVSARISPRKETVEELPFAFAGSDAGVETLTVTLRDPADAVEFELSYTVFPACDVIARSVKVINRSAVPVEIERIMSAQLDLPGRDFDLVQLSGSWARERHAERTPLRHGIQALRSVRGSSGHQNNPACALAATGATETAGDVYGFLLAYSGNFRIEIEVDQFETTRACLGIEPELFRWPLAPGAEFRTPEAFLTFSAEGLGGMSRRFHDFLRRHQISPRWSGRKRPILINNWEATYFDFNAEKILAIAQSAAQLGVEMLVLDDGWFGERDTDTCSLGDWFVNERKIGKLSDLSDGIHALGLQFGLWFEPEMISEKSELYRLHPDWVLDTPERRRSLGREQMMLDMSRPEVVQHLFEVIAGVLRSARIEYIKWDMNRNLTEVYSDALPPERQGEVSHRYVLGVYRLHAMLLAEFPDLLIEGCSGGGGRFDAGMLHYAPQIWCSDDTDAMERIRIQLGTSLFYPASAMGAHVSVCPNHQTGRTTPFDTRAAVALSGTFGYELDLTRLSEEEQRIVRRRNADYHCFHDLIADGALYRLSDAFAENAVDAWCFVSADRRRALLTVVRKRTSTHTPRTLIRLRGLDPHCRYRVNGELRYGDTLMHAGFTPELPERDGAAVLLELIME